MHTVHSPEATTNHDELLYALNDRTHELVDALSTHNSCTQPRQALLDFLRDEFIPHIDHETDMLYRSGVDDVRLLVQALEVQHYVVNLLIDEIAGSDDCMNIAVSASSLVAMSTARFEQEDHILIPALKRMAA